MKRIILASALAIGLAGIALAALPTYKTLSANGNAASPATLTFLSDPNSQVRVIYANWNSDTNKAVMNFTSGTTAFYQTATNAATTTVTNQINSTNGLSASATLVLEHNGTAYTATVSSWSQSTTYTAGAGNGTNVVLNSGGWGVIASVGDNIYLMSSATSLPIGATTNVMTGEAIYVGNYGRPVQAQLTPASVTNQLNSVSVHYDSQSQ